MVVILTVIVFLLIATVALLVLIYFRLGHQMERQIDAAEWLANDHRIHADATATVLLAEIKKSLGALLRELQKASAERRQLMAFADLEAEHEPASFMDKSHRVSPVRSEVPLVPMVSIGDDVPTPRTPYSAAALLGTNERPSS